MNSPSTQTNGDTTCSLALKKLAVALTLTFGTAAAAIFGTGIATPAPAEAGIVSSIKGAAKATVKYTAGGVANWAKATASGAKYGAKTIIVPAAKSVGSATKKVGTTVVKVAVPVGKAIIKAIKRPPGKHLAHAGR